MAAGATQGDGILRFMTCGSVDDGKSTLIGHLLAQTGNVFEDQLATLEEESRRIGNAGDRIDYSLLLDGLIAEREQGITIDVAYRYFRTAKRKFIVADSPGHEEYTRNMAVAASTSSAAIILVDARLGVLPQTRRHALICGLMGVEDLLFAINKMDAVDYSERRYLELAGGCAEIVEAMKARGARARAVHVPVSALHGDNLARRLDAMAWYRGPCVLDWLEGIEAADSSDEAPFRFAVEYVIKPGSGRERWQEGAIAETGPERLSAHRGYAGRILGGSIGRGDEIIVLPSGRPSTVTEIRDRHGVVEIAYAGMSVSISIADQLDISRGDGFVHPDSRQECSDQFKARVVWMQAEPLIAGRPYLLKSAYGQTIAQANRVLGKIDLEGYGLLAAETLGANDIGEIELALQRPLPYDPYMANRWTGSFLLIDRRTNATAGAGVIEHGLRRADNVHPQAFTIDREARAKLLGQRPFVLWFTGLPSSGKSTIANLVEQRLCAMGKHTMLLDGDNVRHGLCKDLGFTEQDRAENIRRVGEAAKLLYEGGMIVLCCFVSPYQADREAVRALFPAGGFIEVFVDTPLEICEARDRKGLYKKARAGEIPNFSGVNAPYEEPLTPELHINAIDIDPINITEEILGYFENL